MSNSPLSRFWSHAQQALTALCASLLPLDTLLAAERRTLGTSLRALEAFCRRLALGEALGLVRDAPIVSARAHVRSAARIRRQRVPALRLWPRLTHARQRIRVLGLPSSVREIEAARRREALQARLAARRTQRKAPHLRLVERIQALRRFLEAPTRGIRALARKLRRRPTLAHAIVARRAPPSPFLSTECVREYERLLFAAARDTS